MCTTNWMVLVILMFDPFIGEKGQKATFVDPQIERRADLRLENSPPRHLGSRARPDGSRIALLPGLTSKPG
jgi:hypothetical protein